jgi:diguanylate cyclase (GGDEF)-like protein/PAS domain S-box-containing protein
MMLHLPRTLHMRLVLAVALIQLLAVSAFAAYWVVVEVSSAVDARQVLAHRMLNIAAPSVERMLGAADGQELRRYLDRVGADPLISGLTVKNLRGEPIYERRGNRVALHWLAARFEPAPLRAGLSTQLWRDGQVLGVLTLSLANEPINAQVNDVIQQVMLFFFVVLVLDLIATQLIIRFFVAPLGPLTEMAMNVSQGVLDSTVMPEATASDEVKKVGLALVTSARMMQKQIRDLEQTRAQLAQNELRLRNLVNSMREVLVELDRNGAILFLNPAWEALTGYAVGECLGKPFSQFLAQPQQQAVFTFGRLETLAPTDVQLEIRARDGHSVWMQMNTAPQYDEHRACTGIVSTLEDVSEQLRLQQLQREHEQELLQLSITDPLTGVYNRRHFDKLMQNVLAMNLGRQQPVALIIIDIDGFKFINDTYGHPVGDEVLRKVADVLLKNREGGVVARLAGDEFAVVLANVGEEAAGAIARAMHQEIGRIVIDLPVGDLHVQTSIGVAVAPAFGTTPQELVRAADVALYHAKKSGRNRVDTLSRDMGEAIMDIFSQGFELRNALQNGLIAPFLQPIHDLQTGGLMAYEVLTRLKRGEEYVAADEFVLIAEDLGLIREMDLFIIRTALGSVPRDVHLFLNISLNSFHSPEFVTEFKTLLQSPLARGRPLTIEITERQTTEIGGEFFGLIQELRAGGVRIALDDFGAGYSTYAYLRQLKPDFVKIDGSFVQQILTDSHDRQIVEHIRELSAAFGAKSIAEHVEDRRTLEALARMGVDYAQGYFFGRPKRVEEYVAATASG